MKPVEMCALVAATGVLALCAGVPALAQQPDTFTTYASGLQGPRGIKFGPDGYLYIAEAGTGGATSTASTSCQQVSGPVGPYTGGKTGRISKVGKDGKVVTVATGFPSALDAMGDVSGVADVAFINDNLYALLAGGGCSHGSPDVASGVALVNQKTGAWHLIADVGAFLKTHPAKFPNPGDFEPDGELYSLLNVSGLLYAVEANHGQVFTVSSGGEISQVFDMSASEGHIVPTSIAHRDTAFYLGNLNLFPVVPGSSKVITISQQFNAFYDLPPGFANHQSGYHIIDEKPGFTAVLGVTFGPDGLLYALEFTTAAGNPSPGTGKVVRVARTGDIEDVITGLVVPTGMAFGPDNRLYVANAGAAPAGAGTILRFDVPPSH